MANECCSEKLKHWSFERRCIASIRDLPNMDGRKGVTFVKVLGQWDDTLDLKLEAGFYSINGPFDERQGFAGGFYLTTSEHLHRFLGASDFVTVVELPYERPDFRLVTSDYHGAVIYKANMIHVARERACPKAL